MITVSDILLFSIKLYLGLMFAFPVLMTIRSIVKDTHLELPSTIVFGIPFVIANMTFNWTVMTAVFWPDRPQAWYEQTTTRMKRYREHKTGRRLKFANFTCRWLNRFDAGHC